MIEHTQCYIQFNEPKIHGRICQGREKCGFIVKNMKVNFMVYYTTDKFLEADEVTVLSAKDKKKLESIQNRAARLVFSTGCRSHAMPLLTELH